MWVTTSATGTSRVSHKLVKGDDGLRPPETDEEVEQADTYSADFGESGKAQVKKQYGEWLVDNHDAFQPASD